MMLIFKLNYLIDGLCTNVVDGNNDQILNMLFIICTWAEIEYRR